MRTFLITLLLGLSLINCSDEIESGAFAQEYVEIKYINGAGQNLFDKALEGSIDTTDIKIYYETLDHGYSPADPTSGQIYIIGDADRVLNILVYEPNNRPNEFFTSYIQLSNDDLDTVVAYMNPHPGNSVIDSLRYNGKLIEPWYSGDLNRVTVVKK